MRINESRLLGATALGGKEAICRLCRLLPRFRSTFTPIAQRRGTLVLPLHQEGEHSRAPQEKGAQALAAFDL
jgi:hypothetical protein